MQKRQKDISQNRWLHPLRGKDQNKFCSRSWCWLGLSSPLQPSGKKAPLQMEKRQKDISQNRWLHPLRGKSRKKKSSAVEAAVCLDFTPPCGPLGKGHLLRWRSDRRKSVKTGGCTLLEGEATQVLQSKLLLAWTLLPPAAQ